MAMALKMEIQAQPGAGSAQRVVGLGGWSTQLTRWVFGAAQKTGRLGPIKGGACLANAHGSRDLAVPEPARNRGNRQA